MQRPILFHRSFISRNSFRDDRTISNWPSGSSQPASSPSLSQGSVIYVVDDMPDLTELYTAVLEGTGYTVRAFNDRNEALEALKTDERKPDLLITDQLCGSMPV